MGEETSSCFETNRFLCNPDNWIADEYDNVLAIIDAGQLARDLATLDNNDVVTSKSTE